MRVFVCAALTAAVAVAMSAGSPVVRAEDKKDEKKEKELMELLDKIETAMKEHKYEEVLAATKKAAEIDPKHPAVHYAAGRAHLGLRQNTEALKAFTEVIKLEPKFSAAYDGRGDANFKLGNFKDAVADYDEYIKAHPKTGPDHWRRGLALYYAGRYKDGAAQFDAAQGDAREDVENSAWHYLCNARANTPKKAREELIPVSKDARVPMKQVLQLFAGKIKPQDVLDAAENAKLKDEALKEARFYAQLYVALYYESEGDEKKCLEHMTEAVEKYKIGHYMWDVAAIHLKVLKAKKK
jgi:lipoprotein NlpI